MKAFRQIVVLFSFTISLSVLSINKISLSEVINCYVYNTKHARQQQLCLQNEILEYKNFKKSMLPAITINMPPVSFNHSMRLLQNYANGEYSNVEEFSNTSSGGISISQKIGVTDGIFTIGSSLSFLRQFSSNSKSFSSTPLYFSYSQKLFGGRKIYSIEKNIYEIRGSVAIKNYCSAISEEQQAILSMYPKAYATIVEAMLILIQHIKNILTMHLTKKDIPIIFIHTQLRAILKVIQVRRISLQVWVC